MKKFMAVVLSLALALSLCACGGGAANSGAAEDTSGAAEETADEAGETVDEAAEPADEAGEPADEAAEPAALPADQGGVVGVYKLTSDYSALSEEDMADMDEDTLTAIVVFTLIQGTGNNVYFVVWEDGTAYLDILGEKSDMTWDEQYFYSVQEDGSVDEDPSPYTFEDGVLTIGESADDSMEFTKLTEEELAYYQENGSGSADEFAAEIEAAFESAEEEAAEEPAAEAAEEPADGAEEEAPAEEPAA